VVDDARERAAGVPASSARFAAWAPLRQPIFRRLWYARMVSNLGT